MCCYVHLRDTHTSLTQLGRGILLPPVGPWIWDESCLCNLFLRWLMSRHMDPNEKAMVKCDVCCTSVTHAGLRAWHKGFQQFCHDHACCCQPLWCFHADHGGEWRFACGSDPADDLPARMLLAITRMSHTIHRAGVQTTITMQKPLILSARQRSSPG